MLKRFVTEPIKRYFVHLVKLAVAETDNTFYSDQPSTSFNRDRTNYDRVTVISDALKAWRINPLARRIVELTNEFVLGADGIKWSCKHKRTANFIKEFWNNRLNIIDIQLDEWVDELTRSGDLLFLCTVDDSCMMYVRAIPPESIDEITTRPNDYRQELTYVPVDKSLTPYEAYDPNSTEQKLFVLHYSVNRVVGSSWGESDLGPTLKWIGYYSAWLENRAMLNRFRTAFLYLVKGKFSNDQDKKKRQAELNANPPQSGSVLVADESEEWSTLTPNLDASDASNDGVALKKNIAAGNAIPMHFLAEPEDSNRTTAEAAGTPTFRHFEKRQQFILWMLKDLIQVAVTVRQRADPRVQPNSEIDLLGNDISERDNASLALAVTYIVNSFGELYDRHLIDESEYLRLVYRFSGEVLDTDKAAPEGLRKDINKPNGTTPITKQPGTPNTNPKVNRNTGDVNVPTD